MMEAVRNGAWAKSGGVVPPARDYVQDGLVAMWDGIENAGWDQHDGSSSIWKNLVDDTRDLHFVHGSTGYSWTKNSLLLNKNNPSNQNLTIEENVIVDPLIGSIEIVFNYHGENDSQPGLPLSIGKEGGSYGSVRSIFQLYKDPSYGDRFQLNSNTQQGVAFVRNTKTSLSAIINTTKSNYQILKLYENAIDTPLVSLSGYFTANKYVNMNGRFERYYVCDCDLHCLRIYNRNISEDEVAANYAIDKARFGLT